MPVLASGKGDREEEAAQLIVDVKKLTEEREQLQEQISQIEGVTSDKDAYFSNLTERVHQSEAVSHLLYSTSQIIVLYYCILL